MRAADRGKPAAERLFSRVSILDDLVPADQDDKLALLADIRKLLTKQTLAAMNDANARPRRARCRRPHRSGSPTPTCRPSWPGRSWSGTAPAVA